MEDMIGGVVCPNGQAAPQMSEIQPSNLRSRADLRLIGVQNVQQARIKARCPQ
jgi:hypothetical protein